MALESISGSSPAERSSEVPNTKPVPGTTHPTAAPPTTFKNLAELKEKAPELYQQTLKTMSLDICAKERKHAEKLKKAMRGRA